MAGVTDPAYRRICRDFGADCAVTEMVSAKALVFGDKKSLILANIDTDFRPVGIQLFGSVPSDFYKAVQILLDSGVVPDFFDLNAGCPMPKITKGGSGCALMREPRTIFEIVSAMCKASDIPVTVKIRAGWDSDLAVTRDLSVTDNLAVTSGCTVAGDAVSAAAAAETAGASEITVHGRTREQMYGGKSDTAVIAAVKAAVAIPVIGNGDITDTAGAARMLKYCDGIAAGRGSYGNPWLFKSLKEGADYAPPLSERIRVMREHIELLVQNKGEYTGMKEARRVTAYYMRGLKGAAALRRICAGFNTMSDFYGFIQRIQNETI